MDQQPLKIVHYPHPTLRHKSKPIKRVDNHLADVIRQMFELMYEANGIGLAANQVDLPLRLFVANLSGKPTARNRFVLRRQFAGVVDYIVPGDCGPASGPSEIRDYASGRVLRPRTT